MKILPRAMLVAAVLLHAPAWSVSSVMPAIAIVEQRERYYEEGRCQLEAKRRQPGWSQLRPTSANKLARVGENRTQRRLDGASWTSWSNLCQPAGSAAVGSNPVGAWREGWLELAASWQDRQDAPRCPPWRKACPRLVTALTSTHSTVECTVESQLERQRVLISTASPPHSLSRSFTLP